MRMRKLFSTRNPSPGLKADSHRRSAVIVLELILGLPILIIFLFAVVEFGLILSLSKQVSFASRFGANLASRESRATLGDLNLPAGGSRLLAAINENLATAGISGGACQVILEHNVAGAADFVQVDPAAGCANCVAPGTSLPEPVLSCAGRPAPETVRVTVCVSIPDHVPDLLCGFGFSIDDCVIRHTTTYRFKDCPDAFMMVPAAPDPALGNGNGPPGN
ncbi:MAG: pilus assembly protein [Planctomycetes bacterium]|nr:pilus assembly protein [Planctomycetota bacterium]